MIIFKANTHQQIHLGMNLLCLEPVMSYLLQGLDGLNALVLFILQDHLALLLYIGRTDCPSTFIFGQ